MHDPPQIWPCRLPAGKIRLITQLFILLLLVLIPTLQGSVPLRHWSIRHWHDDTLSRRAVWAMTEDEKGYLWLGTDGGLARFDGRHFRFFGRDTHSAFTSNKVESLLFSSAQDLWIGSVRGLVRYRGGEFTQIRPESLGERVIWDLCETPDGSIWAATDDGLFQLRPGAEEVEHSFAGTPVRSISFHDDNLWIGTDLDGLHRLRGGSAERVLADEIRSVFHLNPSPDGWLWMSTAGRTRRIKALPDGTFKHEVIIQDNSVDRIFHDRDGAVWMGTNAQGVVRYAESQREQLTRLDGLSGNRIGAIYQTRDGGIWLGTRQGLDQLVRGPVRTLSTKDGLAGDQVWAIAETGRGLWFGGGGLSLKHLEEDAIQSIPRFSNSDVWALLADGEDLLIGTGGEGLFILKPDGATVRLSTANGLASDLIWSLLKSRDGALWVGTDGHGISRIKDGRFQKIDRAAGLPGNRVAALHEARDGAIWVGTNQGIARIRGEEVTSFTASNGLPVNFAWCFYEDEAGTLYIGSDEGGLFRLKDGVFKSVDRTDGLMDDSIFGITVDRMGRLWLNTLRGLISISQAELDRYLDGRSSELRSNFYSEVDGFKGTLYSGGSPVAFRASNGELWFASGLGAAVLDNQAQVSEVKIPQVLIESAIGEQELLEPGERFSLPAGNQRIEIAYTSIDFRSSQDLRFQYRLKGYESDWSSRTTARTAIYTNLQPGSYVFQVRAASQTGAMISPETSIAVVVAPLFYQTWWARLFLLAGIIWGATLVFRRAIKKYKRRNQELFTEVRQRRQAETALQESESRYRNLFENAQDIVFAIDRSGRFLDLNPIFAEITGYPIEEGLEMNLVDLARKGSKATARRLLEAGGICQDLEITSADGAVKTLEVSVISSEDETWQLQGIARDVTERNQLEARLHESEKMQALGQLTGGIAHDFNNLLTVILGQSDLLKQSVDGWAADSLGEICQASSRAAAMTSQLLAFARKQVLSPKVVNLNEIIVNLKVLVRRVVAENVQIRFHLQSDLPAIEVDPVQMEQVILNLAVNAGHAMPDGGVLEIRTASSPAPTGVGANGEVILTVNDSGKGMTPEVAARVFEPFFSTKGETGTGLGLATVYGIVKQSNGQISVTSEPDQGTEFRVCFPVSSRDKQRRSSRDSNTEENSDDASAHVLLVEDDPAICRLVQRVLQSAGHSVLTASRADEAEQLLASDTAVQLLISDVVLPDDSGPAMVGRIKRQHPEIKVLFISGYAPHLIDRHGVFESGIDFLAKPFTAQAIKDRVQKSLAAAS